MKRTESEESISTLEENYTLLDINNSEVKHICKVPPHLRCDGKEKFFTPTSISIGPVHCKNTTLKSNDELKSEYLNKFLERVRKNSSRDKAYDVKAVIRARENDIRSSYSEDISSMGSDELVNMILTDACFIIGFFLRLIGPSEKVPFVKKQLRTEDIKLDLLLLENQLPFFVLEDLFNLAYPTGLRNLHSFFELAFKFFKKELLREINPNMFNHGFTYFDDQIKYNRCLPVFHLNDMLRMLYLPYYLPNIIHKSPQEKPIYTASKLHEAGITFKSCHESITQLQYSSNGVLTIPCILVSDRTEKIIRNVIALEQCHYKDLCFVTDYFILWDHLINDEKDVEVLVQKGIIKNFMGDNNAVKSLFNGLCRNVDSTSCNAEYDDLYKKLNKFCSNTFYKHMAILRREYFSTPWKIASVVAAIVLLFLTLIQTICSVVALFE